MTSKIISLKSGSIHKFSIEPGNEYTRNAIWCLDNGYTLKNLTSMIFGRRSMTTIGRKILLS